MSGKMPEDVSAYLEKCEFNQTMNSSFNKMIRELPKDPYAFMASILNEASKDPVCIFDKVVARECLLCETQSSFSV